MVLLGACLAPLSHAAAWAAMPADPGAKPAITPAFKDLNDELQSRLEAALHVAFDARTTTPDDEAARLRALSRYEREFDANLSSHEELGVAIKDFPELTQPLRIDAPRGVQSFDPIRKKMKPADYASTYKKYPALQSGLFYRQMMLYASECLPKEEKYNQRFVDYVFSQPLKFPPGRLAMGRYGLVAELREHKCVSDKYFTQKTAPLVPAILKHAHDPKLVPGDLITALHLLASTGRFERIPDDLLLRFARAQEKDGGWRTDSDTSRSRAAEGAYLLAKMLQKRGAALHPRVLRKPTNTSTPVLPSSSDERSSPP